MDTPKKNQVLENDDKKNEGEEAKGEKKENVDEIKEHLDGDSLNEEIQKDKNEGGEGGESGKGGEGGEGEEGEESGNVDNEEPVPSPPPDLGQVSEEIDEYILAMSNFDKGDGSPRPPPPEVPISVEQFTVLVDALIKEYDSSDVPVKWDKLTDEDAVSFSEALDRLSKLSKALSEYSCEENYANSINTVGRIFERSMGYLEEEFRSFLEDHKVSEEDQNNESKSKQSSTPKVSNQEGEENAEAEPDPEDEKDNVFHGYSEETMTNLYKLANILMKGGHETECGQIYYIARRNYLEEKLHDHGFEKHSIDDVQKMNWDVLEKDIVSWNETVKQFTTIHIINEHKLAAIVFKDHPSIAESLFNNLARGTIMQLLNFSEAVAMTKRAAEKLFKYLDVYESLGDIHSKIEDLLASEFSNELKSEATLTRGRLGEATISIFRELENSIKLDSGKTPVPGGAVHPLTRYTMNYLEYTCEYMDTLEQVFRQHQKIERSDSASGSEYDINQDQAHNSCNNDGNVKKQQSPFEMQIEKVLDLLHENIESKSKLYKDIPLSLIFMMNNGRYILQKIKACRAISGLLNDTWCRKKSSNLRQYHKNYQRETWSKLLNVLINHEGLLVHGKVLKPVLKERFKSFNMMFEEIIRTQTPWVIADEQLQSELRVSISNMVVPAYRSFMGRFSSTFTPGRQTEKYVKFQSEDVESCIDELFSGSSAPLGRWRL